MTALGHCIPWLLHTAARPRTPGWPAHTRQTAPAELRGGARRRRPPAVPPRQPAAGAGLLAGCHFARLLLSALHLELWRQAGTLLPASVGPLGHRQPLHRHPACPTHNALDAHLRTCGLISQHACPDPCTLGTCSRHAFKGHSRPAGARQLPCMAQTAPRPRMRTRGGIASRRFACQASRTGIRALPRIVWAGEPTGRLLKRWRLRPQRRRRGLRRFRLRCLRPPLTTAAALRARVGVELYACITPFLTHTLSMAAGLPLKHTVSHPTVDPQACFALQLQRRVQVAACCMRRAFLHWRLRVPAFVVSSAAAGACFWCARRLGRGHAAYTTLRPRSASPSGVHGCSANRFIAALQAYFTSYVSQRACLPNLLPRRVSTTHVWPKKSASWAPLNGHHARMDTRVHLGRRRRPPGAKGCLRTHALLVQLLVSHTGMRFIAPPNHAAQMRHACTPAFCARGLQTAQLPGRRRCTPTPMAEAPAGARPLKQARRSCCWRGRRCRRCLVVPARHPLTKLRFGGEQNG